ncbi:methyltransferase domain-containing protein [Saccharopolyspora oryzae]|uniref:Methyltransferase domain-containing protein n=1 Tax=Saccharopolyspora oryzae TaxID=2997343 RepID=A0ABT4USD5_9PSEU|nr:methyltransferase domain-containing protein [Saccharopolyspora oryzae]MDA3624629.1 methyltransferase domain-containing protein [Saccharopolyspora oryzae]
MTHVQTDKRGYVFDNHSPHSGEQHRCLAEALDPITTERLAATGVTAGWHCLDVGCGGGTISRWLANRVGPTGSVLATDVKPVDVVGHPNMTTAQHDITADPLPENHFDLIVARLVLQHLPERDEVLAKLVRALKPGGWLQIDEFDTSYEPVLLAPDEEGERVYEKFLAAKTELMRRNGGDPTWGRQVARAMRAAGLVDIDPRPSIRSRHAGSADLGLQLHHTHQLWDRLQSAGMTSDELHAVQAVMRDPSFRASSSVIYSVQGRKERRR